MQGAEVLKIGTDARVEVVNDDARAQGKVRRAAALTAELAAKSEKKTSAVCDQPPGLDELAGHIEAPKMGAGGSHPQATMMPDPWATYKCPSASDNQAETIASSETNRIPADKRSSCSNQDVPWRSTSISNTSSVDTFARSELDEGKVTAKKPHRAGTSSLSEERRSMGTLPKATDSHAENKRKLRDEVQGESTGRHLQQQQG